MSETSNRRKSPTVRDALVFVAGVLIGQGLLTAYVVWMLP